MPRTSTPSRDDGVLADLRRHVVSAPLREHLGDVPPSLAVLTFWLERCGRLFDALQQTRLRRFGLDTSEFAALNCLRLTPGEGLTPTQLNSFLAMTSGGVTKTINRLVAKGHVQRTPDPSDGRGVIVVLTESGARLTASAFERLHEDYQQWFEEWTESDRWAASDQLRALIDRLEQQDLEFASP